MRLPHLPNWLTWILHGLISLALYLIFDGPFSPGQTAGLKIAELVWWVDREESQGGIRSLDDYGDLIGPVLVTAYAIWRYYV